MKAMNVIFCVVLFSVLLIFPSWAVAGQEQGQQQIVTSSMVFTFSPHSESAAYDFVFAGSPNYGNTLPYFGVGKQILHNITPLKILQGFKTRWSMEEAVTGMIGEVVVIVNFWVPEGERWNPTKRCDIIEELPNRYLPVAYLYAWAMNTTTDTTANALIGAVRATMKCGGKKFMPTVGDSDPSVESGGWGVGGFSTQGWLWGNGSFGNSAGGGTGINKTKSGPRGKPHVQGCILWVE
jgi:hypothetical protein